MRYLLISLLAYAMGGLVSAQTITQAQFNAGLDAGWTIQNGGTSLHTWGTPATYNGNTLNGSAFAFVDSDAAGNFPDTVLSEQLLSPVFNGSAYPQVFLEFDHYYRQYSNDSGFVEVYDGTGWVAVRGYSTNQGAWGAPATEVVDLTAYRNANMQVRFRYEDYGIWAWFWAVDNVQLYAPLPVDARMDSLSVPSGTCGLGTTEPISIHFSNVGTSPVTSLNASYQINGGAIITEAVTATVAPGASQSYTFVTGANLSAGGTYDIRAWLSLAGDGNALNDSANAPTVTNHVAAGALPYVEDFETGQAGWFTGGTSSTWAFGTPAKDVIMGAASGQNAWVTGGLGTGNYDNNEASYLESPCFDFSGVANPWVGMDLWWNIEWSWDGAALLGSSDGGANWQVIGAYGDPYNWYTDNTINAQPGGQQDGWSGRQATNDGSNGYVPALHGASAFGGESEVIFRIAFATDASVTDDGLAVDNFRVGVPPSVNLGPDTVACDSLVLDAGPGDSYLWSTGATTRFLGVDTTGLYTVTVFDSLGFPGYDDVYLTVYATGAVSLGPDTLLCDGQNLLLNADPLAQSILWSDGSTGSQLLVDTAGTYWVQVVQPSGCIEEDTVVVQSSTLEANFTAPSDTLCRGLLTQFTSTATGATSWWWNFGNGNFSANQNPSQVFTSGGTFTVTLTVEDGTCTDVIAIPFFVDVCVGVEEVRPEAQAALFPNPHAGRARLKWESLEAGSVELELWDLRGQRLRTWTEEVGFGAQVVDLWLEDLADGRYFLRMQQGETMQMLHMVIQR